MRNVYDIKEICTVPPPYGGVTVYVKRLIEYLTRDGLSVGGYYTENCKDEDIINSSMFDKWTWMETSMFPLKIWKYLREVAPYRIVHSHFSLEGMAYLWAMKFFLQKKIVVTIHNSMNKTYYDNTNPINRFFLKLMLRSREVRWVTVSEQGKKQLLQFPVPPLSEVAVVPAYIPIEYDNYVPLNEDMSKYIRQNDKTIAFYGHSFMTHNGDDVYGFKTAIKAYADLLSLTDEKIGFVLCLAEDSDMEKIIMLEDYARENNVLEKIFWQIGAIDNIRTLWHEADIYLRPTSTDGDSVAVREALDEGMVVIASDVCVRPDGVLTYEYGNNAQIVDLVLKNLKTGKAVVKPNFQFYYRMKQIYIDLLKEIE